MEKCDCLLCQYGRRYKAIEAELSEEARKLFNDLYVAWESEAADADFYKDQFEGIKLSFHTISEELVKLKNERQ